MDKILKTSEVCDILGISQKTLLKYVALGKLNPIRVNKRTFRYRETELLDFLNQHTAKPI